MIRLIGILIAAGLIAAGIAWIVDQQGALVFTIGHYEARMSASVAIALIVLFAALIGFLTRLAAAILSGPGAIGAWFSARRSRRGNDALSRGLVAVAAGDPFEARRQTQRARDILGDHPLALLLTAQAAQLEGDGEGQRAAYHAMREHAETEFLGLRGLFMLAMREDDKDEALSLAARAHALKPRALWAANALFDLKAARGAWRDAKEVLDDMARVALIDPDLARRRRAVLLAAEALEADRSGDSEHGLALALEALKLSPSLVPAAVLAARKLAASGKLWRAQDVIEAAWIETPHPDLAFVYGAMKPGEDRVTRAQRLTQLAHLNRDHFESRMLEAEEAVNLKQWAKARRLLAPLAHGAASARVCALMAEIEEAEHGDATAAHIWLSRAARAPRDAQWLCGHCSAASAEWTPVCAACGGFDTLHWSGPATLETLPADEHPIATEGEGFVREDIAFVPPRDLPPPRPAAKEHGFVVLTRPPDDPGPGGLDFEGDVPAQGGGVA
jgi:HemY protein